MTCVLPHTAMWPASCHILLCDLCPATYCYVTCVLPHTAMWPVSCHILLCDLHPATYCYVTCVLPHTAMWPVSCHILLCDLRPATYCLVLYDLQPGTAVILWPASWHCHLSKTRSRHTKVQNNAYLLWHGHTICKLSGEIPFVKPQNDT